MATPNMRLVLRWLSMVGAVLVLSLVFVVGLALGAAPSVRRALAQGLPVIGRAMDAIRPAAPPSGFDWPTYGGNLSNSFANADSALTAAAAPKLRLLWQAPADGEVAGNPVAVGGQVFFDTFAGSVYAAERGSGQVIWRRTLDGTPLDGGPLYDGGRLYVATSGGLVYCLDPRDGSTIWTSVSLLNGLPDALRASPRAYAGVLYQSVGGTNDDRRERGAVVALDEQTGKVLWRTDMVTYQGGGAAVFSPPAIIPQLGELVVATGNPTPYPNNNENAGSRAPVPPGDDPYSNSVVALSLSDGHVLWAQQTHAADAADLDFMAGPNVITLARNRLAVGAGEKDGSYYLFDARTGAPLWSAHLNLEGSETLVLATAAASGRRIFVGTMDVPNNATHWPEHYQAPAGGRLFALDAETGKVLWSDDLKATVAAAPAAGAGIVYAVGADGTVFGVNAANGRVLWRFATGGQIWNVEAGLSLAGDELLVPLASPGGVAAFGVS